jgi:hypothetical protein
MENIHHEPHETNVQNIILATFYFCVAAGSSTAVPVTTPGGAGTSPAAAVTAATAVPAAMLPVGLGFTPVPVVF